MESVSFSFWALSFEIINFQPLILFRYCYNRLPFLLLMILAIHVHGAKQTSLVIFVKPSLKKLNVVKKNE